MRFPEARYIRAAFRITIPVLFGYIAIGIPFGLMVVNAGYPWCLAPIMSVLMYAGAGQYAAVGLFAANASLTAVIITTLLVNIRHAVYGLSLITPFKNVGGWKFYLIFALTDETYALLTGVQPPDGIKPGVFYGMIAAFDQCYWILGGVAGAVAGALIPVPLDGVDFALTALFIVLVVDQLRRTKDIVPVLIGAACSLCAMLLAPSDNMLIVALCAGLVALTLVRGADLRRLRKRTDARNGERS